MFGHHLLWLAVSFFSFIGPLLPFMVHYHHQLLICITTLRSINVFATPVLVVAYQNTRCRRRSLMVMWNNNALFCSVTDKSNVRESTVFPSTLIENIHPAYVSLSNTLKPSLCSQTSQEGACVTGNSHAGIWTCQNYAFIRKIFNVKRLRTVIIWPTKSQSERTQLMLQAHRMVRTHSSPKVTVGVHILTAWC